MAAHPYGLRSRLNNQSPALRTPPPGSPIAPKVVNLSPRKPRPSDISLHLQRVIGTTTSSPNGLASCAATNRYAYCAGAVAVLARPESGSVSSHRYYKARPTAPSINPSTSYYDSASPAGTPSKRRASGFPTRKTQEDLSSTAGREWSDEASGQTWTARERIKAASCVSLSPDGQWLAVGESGYNPRVLLFSTDDDASCEIPTSIICDHTHGVRSIAFSPDMKFLATLGTLNDGFLFVWQINAKTGQLSLHSANKCTTSVCDMTWCGTSLITVGTRHIKIWQVADIRKQSPFRKSRFRPSEVFASNLGPAPLQGRNCLLGVMVDSTFTCVVALDGCLAAVGDETGHVCLVDTSQSGLELKVLKRVEFPISSIAFRPSTRHLLLGTSHGLHIEDYDSLVQAQNEGSRQGTPARPRVKPRLSAVRRSLGLLNETSKSIVAVGTLSGYTINLDSEGNLQLQLYEEDGEDLDRPMFASHNSVIQGVQSLPPTVGIGDFYTWSKNGELKFWDTAGTLLQQATVDLDQADNSGDQCENELTRMCFIPQTSCFAAGDRFGVVKLVRRSDWQVVSTLRAHSAEVTSIVVSNSEPLLATCSRDRMVQLFRVDDDKFELLQTMDDHVGAVHQVLFTHNAEKLLSCSADRSVIIRDRVSRTCDEVQITAYLSTKVLTLKASPLSMTLPDEANLMVSTMDRRVTNIDISSGTLADSFKVGDTESEDTVALNSIVCTTSPEGIDGCQRVLIGYSSMDKSIRVYNERNLHLLGRESGHTEGVSDIEILQNVGEGASDTRTVVSTGLDGTILIWTVAKAAYLTAGQELNRDGTQTLGSDVDGETVKASPASLPPLRKILSKFDIAELTRASGQLSPVSPRSVSPVRLKRKTSKLALSTTIEDVEETPTKAPEPPPPPQAASVENEKPDSRRSPSPPLRTSSQRPRPQRSRTDFSKDLEVRRSTFVERSPSPPPTTAPSTPRHRQTPNNSRLRRPPSVPTDLRSHAMSQGRRQSMSHAPDFGSIGMATEQACRMLRTYKKKLSTSKEYVDLDELEDEVTAMLKTIKERKGKTRTNGATPKIKQTASSSDVDSLTVLLDRTNLKDETAVA